MKNAMFVVIGISLGVTGAFGYQKFNRGWTSHVYYKAGKFHYTALERHKTKAECYRYAMKTRQRFNCRRAVSLRN